MANPHRIILIEDNPADVELLRQALEEQNEPFSLEVIADGEAALDFVRLHCSRCAPEPCLIVLDLHLPRYDGTAVLRAIKADPELGDVDVVVLTTMASPVERDEVLALGVAAYRVKPIDWQNTVELARELIEICTRPRQSQAAR